MFTNLSHRKMLIVPTLLILMLGSLAFVSDNARAQATKGYEKWGPRVDYLQLIIYGTFDLETQAFRAGSIDTMDWPLDYDNYFAIKDDPDFVLEPLTMFDIYDIDINNLRWPTSDYRFRQAIAHLIDYESFYTNILRAYVGELMDNIVWWEPEWTEWYNPDAPKYWYDPTLALNILAAAGYQNWDADSQLEWKAPNNTIYELPNLEFWVREDDPLRAALGDIMTADINAVGIPITEHKAGEDVVWQHIYQMPYDYHMGTAGMGPFRDLQFLYDYYHSQFSTPDEDWAWNNVFFVNSTYDYWVEQLKFAPDEATAQEACKNAEEIFMEQVPLIPVYHSAGATAYRANYGQHSGEEVYAGMPWKGFVNTVIPTVNSGVNDWFSLLNAHPGDVERGGALRFGMINELEHVNPVTSYSTWDLILLEELYGSLIMRDPYTGQNIPWLAKEWTVETWDYEGETASKLTFKLYDNLKWSDGTPLTSADVAFSLKYVYDASGSSYYSYVERIDGIDTDTPHIETPDATTVVVYFNVETVWALEMLGATPIIPKHVWETIPTELVEEEGEFVKTGNLTGSGPFVIDSHKEGEYWLLKRNPYFFRGLAGDIDTNGIVNIVDITLVAKDFGKNVPPANPLADLNGDQKVNIVDITIVAKNYGRTA
jgi:peptide/nickel transport system substrate-binding protein